MILAVSSGEVARTQSSGGVENVEASVIGEFFPRSKIDGSISWRIARSWIWIFLHDGMPRVHRRASGARAQSLHHQDHGALAGSGSGVTRFGLRSRPLKL